MGGQFVGAAFLACALVPTAALAQTSSGSAPIAAWSPRRAARPPRRSACPRQDACAPQRRWYGWQTLVVFGGSLALGAVMIPVGSALIPFSAGDPGIGVALGATGAVLGGPIVHWAHGHVARGFGSLGINLGMPLVGSLVGLGVGSNWSARVAAAGVGAAIGLVAALVLDVSLLAYDELPPAQTQARRTSRVVLLPDVQLSAGRTTFGVVGVF